MQITERLQEIFRDIFAEENLVLFDEMTADDVEDWDSLSHIQLITAIESDFKIEFTTDEILKLKNVGEFIKLLTIKWERDK